MTQIKPGLVALSKSISKAHSKQSQILVRHLARKQSGSILTTLEPTRANVSINNKMAKSCNAHQIMVLLCL